MSDLAWVLPSVTHFFSSPKKVGKKRFLPSLFELLAQAIPENVTPPSNSVLPGHPHMAIAKGLVAPEGTASEIFKSECNILINTSLFFLDQESLG